MRFGLKVASYSDEPPAGMNHWDLVQAMVETCEAHGFDSVWVNDHFMFRQADPGALTPWLECFVTLGAIAAITERVKLGALVAGIPYRNPALFAKMSTTLDVISHGRSVVGIGAGWHKDEFDAYNWPFPSVKDRMEMLEEATIILKMMMTERASSVTGKHYTIREALNDPRPVQHPHPPIMIGGSGEKRTLRLVAQYADWCNVGGTVENVARLFDVLRRHCQDVGRPFDQITRSIDFWGMVARDEAEARQKRERYKFDGWIGTPEEWISLFRRYADVGVEAVTLSMPDAPELESIRLLGETVIRELMDVGEQPRA